VDEHKDRTWTDFECHTEELVPISVTNKIDTTKTNTSNHLSAFVEEDANPANSPDYSPEITPPLDFSSPLSTPRDWLSPRPLVPPNTTESPNIRHTLSDSRLDDAASPRQSGTFVEARTNDSYALSYPVTPKVPAWIPSISSATPTSIPHPLISVQEDFSPKKEKVTRKIDRIRRDIPRFVHVSSSRDLSSTIPEPHYVSSSPPCDPATPKAPVWTPLILTLYLHIPKIHRLKGFFLELTLFGPTILALSMYPLSVETQAPEYQSYITFLPVANLQQSQSRPLRLFRTCGRRKTNPKS
jgi:hypothetical protein